MRKVQSIHSDLVDNKLLIYLISGDQEHSAVSTYLFILIGSHSYKLRLREGAVHHHPVWASHSNYVYLGLIFMQGVQHYLQKRKERGRPQYHSGIPPLLFCSGFIIDLMSLPTSPVSDYWEHKSRYLPPFWWTKGLNGMRVHWTWI